MKTIDIALAAAIRLDRIRQDVAAYRAQPLVEDEMALVAVPPSWADLHDDTDWDALYGDGS